MLPAAAGIATFSAISAATITAPIPAYTQGTCSAAISSVRLEIENRMGAKILSTKIDRNISSPFANAQKEVVIWLGSQLNDGITPKESRAGEEIIKSNGMTKAYTQRIISGCKQVASVIFRWYEYNSGWVVKPGGLQEIRCVDPGKTLYAWGEIPCL